MNRNVSVNIRHTALKTLRRLQIKFQDLVWYASSRILGVIQLREMARLVEVKQKWKARMRKYVTFVTLGIPTTQSHIRRRRNSYLLASGMTASERRQSITTTIVEQQPHFPLAFKVLTPQYNSFSSEVVIDINSQETLKSIEQRLMQEVGPQRLPEHDGSEKIEVPETPTPETITEVFP